jgi:flagellar biosynthesis protein FlhA
VKDLVNILEALIDYSKVTKNIDVLTEYVRHAMGDTIANIYKDNNGIIHAVALNEDVEAAITKSLQNQKEATQTLGLNPQALKELYDMFHVYVEHFKELGFIPVIITSATIRPYFYRLINASFPDMAILSYSELPSNIEIEFIEKLEVADAN